MTSLIDDSLLFAQPLSLQCWASCQCRTRQAEVASWGRGPQFWLRHSSTIFATCSSPDPRTGTRSNLVLESKGDLKTRFIYFYSIFEAPISQNYLSCMQLQSNIQQSKLSVINIKDNE